MASDVNKTLARAVAQKNVLEQMNADLLESDRSHVEIECELIDQQCGALANMKAEILRSHRLRQEVIALKREAHGLPLDMCEADCRPLRMVRPPLPREPSIYRTDEPEEAAS